MITPEENKELEIKVLSLLSDYHCEDFVLICFMAEPGSDNFSTAHIGAGRTLIHYILAIGAVIEGLMDYLTERKSSQREWAEWDPSTKQLIQKIDKTEQ